jgi:hypothetical protein
MRFEAKVKESEAESPELERLFKQACSEIREKEEKKKSGYYKRRTLRLGYMKELGRVYAQDVPKAAIPELQKAIEKYVEQNLKIKGHLHPWIIRKIEKGKIVLECADKDCEAKEVLDVSDGFGLAGTLVYSFWRALDGKRLNRYTEAQSKKINDFLSRHAKQIFQDAAQEIDLGIEISKAMFKKYKDRDKDELGNPLPDYGRLLRKYRRMKEELTKAKLPLSF